MSSVLRGMRRRALKRAGIKTNIAERWAALVKNYVIKASGLLLGKPTKRPEPDAGGDSRESI